MTNRTQNIIDRIRLPFRKDKELIISLYNILGFYPHKMPYYKLALMHKSIGHRTTAEDVKASFPDRKKRKGKNRDGKGKDNRQIGRKVNNERLEFLGDAILDAVVGDIVYSHFPGKPEGFLTNTRSKLVQRETLGKLAHEIGLSRLILSSGRSSSHNSYMAGNAFEALVGAIYLDRGYDACMKFMQQRILGRYINIDRTAYKEVNFKSKLIEWTQKNRVNLAFRLEDEAKDKNGSPMFKYTAVLETVDGATGSGYSKKESQQHACEETLRMLRKDAKFLDSIFAAKTERTKMDEDMIQVVPDVEKAKEESFFIENKQEGTAQASTSEETKEQQNAIATESGEVLNDLDMDLSDITAKPDEPSKNDIIDKAEELAYKAEGL